MGNTTPLADAEPASSAADASTTTILLRYSSAAQVADTSPAQREGLLRAEVASVIDRTPYKADLMRLLGAMADCAHEAMRASISGPSGDRQIALHVRLDHLLNEFALRWQLTCAVASEVASLKAALTERDTIEQALRLKAQRLTGEVDTLRAAARVDMKLIRELQRDLSNRAAENRVHVETIAILRGKVARLEAEQQVAQQEAA